MDPKLLASRLICMFLMLIGTFAFGVSPIFVKKTLFKCDCGPSGVCLSSCRARRGKLITAFLIYFGGGVLLGTTFLHLLPEAREGFEIEEHTNCTEKCALNITDDDDGGGHEHAETFPMAEFIVCLGFFSVYLFEEVVHHFLGGHTHVPPENRAIRSFSRSNSCTPSTIGEHITAKTLKDESQTCPSQEVIVVHDPPSTKPLTLTALLTVAALSFHSFFEGFALGLRPDATSTWIVFAAVAVHKFVIAFVVGLQVIATEVKNKELHVYIYMGIFSVMSPIGMACAWITEQSVEDTSPLTVSVLNAIATGTLLYVTFFEILQREENKDIPTWVQLIATSSGFVVMCFMQYGSTFAV